MNRAIQSLVKLRDNKALTSGFSWQLAATEAGRPMSAIGRKRTFEKKIYFIHVGRKLLLGNFSCVALPPAPMQSCNYCTSAIHGRRPCKLYVLISFVFDAMSCQVRCFLSHRLQRYPRPNGNQEIMETIKRINAVS